MAVKGNFQISGMNTMSEAWQRTTEDLGVPSKYMKVNNPGKWAVTVKNNSSTRGTQTEQPLEEND